MLAQVANMAYHYKDPRLSKKGLDTLEKVYSYLSTAGEDTRLLWQADPLPLPPQSSEIDLGAHATREPTVAALEPEVTLEACDGAEGSIVQAGPLTTPAPGQAVSAGGFGLYNPLSIIMITITRLMQVLLHSGAVGPVASPRPRTRQELQWA